MTIYVVNGITYGAVMLLGMAIGAGAYRLGGRGAVMFCAVVFTGLQVVITAIITAIMA